MLLPLEVMLKIAAVLPARERHHMRALCKALRAAVSLDTAAEHLARALADVAEALQALRAALRPDDACSFDFPAVRIRVRSSEVVWHAFHTSLSPESLTDTGRLRQRLADTNLPAQLRMEAQLCVPALASACQLADLELSAEQLAGLRAGFNEAKSRFEYACLPARHSV